MYLLRAARIDSDAIKDYPLRGYALVRERQAGGLVLDERIDLVL